MSRITDYILEEVEAGRLEYTEETGYIVPTINLEDDFVLERERWVTEQFELSLEEVKWV